MHIDRRFSAVRGRRASTLVVLLLGVVCLASCQPRAARDTAPRTLRIAFGIGPSTRASGVSVLADLLYTEPLIAHDAAGRPEPALASKWTWGQEGRLLTIQLKPGVRFHDGSPLTAELVVALLEQRTRRTGSVPIGFQRITSITAPDPLTVVIRLSAPDFFLLSDLNELRIVHPAQRDIGTGAFRLVRRQPIVEAERNEDYHGGRPAFGGVQIVTYETQRAAWAALMRGEADAVQELSRESVEFMERSSHVETYASMQPYYIPLVFNQQHPALRNPAVRRALVMALDKAAIVERALRKRGAVADTPIWPAHWAFQPPEAVPAHDPATSAQLLDAAGFPRKATPGGPDARFTLRCLFISEDPQYERIALMVQKQLFDIGVQVDLEPLTMSALAERAAAGTFDTVLARANAGRTLMFTYLFWRSPESGRSAFWTTGYTGADAALDRLRETTTEHATRDALTALSNQFSADAPAAFIAWTEVTRAVSAGISVGEPAPRDPFTAIWRWRPHESGLAGQ